MSEEQAVDTSVASAEPTNWYESLPEGLKDNPNIIKYKSIDDLAQGHVNAVQLIGRDKIPLPKTDAEFRDAYAKLGMPETADKYELPDIEGLESNLYSRERIDADKTWWKEQAHAIGLSNKQAATAYQAFLGRESASMAEQAKAIEFETNKAEVALREAWGEAYDQNITIANRAMSKLFGDGATEAIIASGLGRNPSFISGLHKFGLSVLEDLGIDKRGAGVMTPNQLAEDMAQLQAHPAYFDKTHPEHDSIVARVYSIAQRLYKE